MEEEANSYSEIEMSSLYDSDDENDWTWYFQSVNIPVERRCKNLVKLDTYCDQMCPFCYIDEYWDNGRYQSFEFALYIAESKAETSKYKTEEKAYLFVYRCNTCSKKETIYHLCSDIEKRVREIYL